MRKVTPFTEQIHIHPLEEFHLGELLFLCQSIVYKSSPKVQMLTRDNFPNPPAIFIHFQLKSVYVRSTETLYFLSTMLLYTWLRVFGLNWIG